jgi:hypothetical protein
MAFQVIVEESPTGLKLWTSPPCRSVDWRRRSTSLGGSLAVDVFAAESSVLR